MTKEKLINAKKLFEASKGKVKENRGINFEPSYSFRSSVFSDDFAKTKRENDILRQRIEELEEALKKIYEINEKSWNVVFEGHKAVSKERTEIDKLIRKAVKRKYLEGKGGAE